MSKRLEALSEEDYRKLREHLRKLLKMLREKTKEAAE